MDRKAFKKAKETLASVLPLHYIDEGAHLMLTTDASEIAIGTVLEAHTDNDILPFEFYSKCLDNTQQRYSTYDRELLAIYEVIAHFQDVVEGCKFTIYTDHKHSLRR